MPRYVVTLSDGRKFQIEANAPPSESDVMAALSRHTVDPSAALPPEALGVAPPALPDRPQTQPGAIPQPSTASALEMVGQDLEQRERARIQGNAPGMPTLGATVGSFVGGVPGAAVGGALGEAARQAALRSVDAEGAPDTAGEQMRSVAVQGGLHGAIEGAGKGIQLLGKAAYKGGVALLPKTLKQQHPEIAKVGFEEGIPLTRRGARRADAAVSGSRQQADDLLAAAEQAGASRVQPRQVIKSFRPVRDKMRRQVDLGLPDETGALAGRARTFARRHQGGIPLTQAQALKREAQDLAETAYKARDRGATINAMEALTNEAQARGLREAIEGIVPEVGPINARTQGLMGVLRGAEHAAETGHVLSRLGGVGAGTLLGSAGGMAPALAAGGAGAMLTTPGGLTVVGLGGKRLGAVAPQAARAAMLLRLLGEQVGPEQPQ